jgi:hypothetical protein
MQDGRWSRVQVGQQVILNDLVVLPNNGITWSFSLPILVGRSIAGNFGLGQGTDEGLSLWQDEDRIYLASINCTDIIINPLDVTLFFSS